MGISINTHRIKKKQENFWNNIHFHPTDAIEDDWGKRILNEIAKDKAADTVRMYAMLEDIVSMDENGNILYDFTLNDQRIDYMIDKGFNLLISYNFIPDCIASVPNAKSSVSKNKTRYKGKMITTSIPKDYGVWEEICYRYTKHLVDRYSLETVSKWYLQCYNEPDAPDFFMSNIDSDASEERMKEYCKLYRGFERGINRVSHELNIGGPALAERLPFLDGFLQYVKDNNLQLNYISAHNYGTYPEYVESGKDKFTVNNNLRKYISYMEIIDKYYPDGIDLVMDEWGATIRGYTNKEECPLLMFRETEVFAAYFTKMVTEFVNRNMKIKKLMICLSGQHEMKEDFTGFRNFFTLNFIKKPIYNAFVLMRRLKENVLEYVCDNENITVLATKDDKKFSTLLTYSSENFDLTLKAVKESVHFDNVTGEKNVTVWVIDSHHTNPFTVFKEKGFGGELNEEQIKLLQEEGCLKPIREYTVFADGELTVDVELVNNSTVLIEF